MVLVSWVMRPEGNGYSPQEVEIVRRAAEALSINHVAGWIELSNAR